MIDALLARHVYVGVVVLLAAGLYALFDRNLVKKVVGLNLFQTGIFLFLVTVGFRTDAGPPLLETGGASVNPLPHVLVLTAIVVGLSVTALSLGLVVSLYGTYGSLSEDEIREAIDD